MASSDQCRSSTTSTEGVPEPISSRSAPRPPRAARRAPAPRAPGRRPGAPRPTAGPSAAASRADRRRPTAPGRARAPRTRRSPARSCRCPPRPPRGRRVRSSGRRSAPRRAAPVRRHAREAARELFVDGVGHVGVGSLPGAGAAPAGVAASLRRQSTLSAICASATSVAATTTITETARPTAVHAATRTICRPRSAATTGTRPSVAYSDAAPSRPRP